MIDNVLSANLIDNGVETSTSEHLSSRDFVFHFSCFSHQECDLPYSSTSHTHPKTMMNTSECSLSFRGLALWVLVLHCAFCGSRAALRTFYVEEVCYGWTNAFIDVRHYTSGILSSLSSDRDFSECTIRLKPEVGSSIVLSLYRHNLEPQDSLIIEDSRGFKVALLGEGDFPDEQHSFYSEGIMALHYSRHNGTQTPRSRLKFQFVFTQVHEGPCRYNEFQCRNRKCIPNKLLCNRHNHCGDNSDQEECGPRVHDAGPTNYPSIGTVKTTTQVWLITIIVSGSVLVIIVIVMAAVLIKGAVQKKKAAGKFPTTVASIPQSPTAPVEPPQQAVAPPLSVFGRIRQSLRGHRSEPKPDGLEDKQSDGYQVPSMYPHIPPEVHSSGVDNPEFKADV